MQRLELEMLQILSFSLFSDQLILTLFKSVKRGSIIGHMALIRKKYIDIGIWVFILVAALVSLVLLPGPL